LTNVFADPLSSDWLSVGQGNSIYWETSGNPDGVPAIRLYGGPGSGLSSGYRRDFDPEVFLIAGLDQQGRGRSRPLETDDLSGIASNATANQLSDLEALREHLDIERWMITGVSLGTALALAYAYAYAQAFPERMLSLVLAAVVTTSDDEVDWGTEQMGRVFPREWEEFAAASGARNGQRIIDAHHERIIDPDSEVRAAAARAWWIWDDVHVSLDPLHSPSVRYENADFRLLFATLVIHYWKHGGFADGLLLRMPRLANIPGVLIQGRLDMSAPLRAAWNLHREWPSSDLIVLENEGHGGTAMGETIRDAIAKVTGMIAPG
jgi:proline iminopeptidase